MSIVLNHRFGSAACFVDKERDEFSACCAHLNTEASRVPSGECSFFEGNNLKASVDFAGVDGYFRAAAGGAYSKSEQEMKPAGRFNSPVFNLSRRLPHAPPRGKLSTRDLKHESNH